jgi:hypothetical protein
MSPPYHIFACLLCYYRFYEIRKYGITVVSSGIMFVPNFVEIDEIEIRKRTDSMVIS